MTSLKVRRLTYAALYLAIALVLPFVTGQIPEIGSMLCPMHIPALLCGFMCGWPWGLAVGFIAPPLRSVLFGMPAMFPGAVAMAFELAVYGGMAGILYARLPRKKGTILAALVLSMVAGRVVWGAVRVFLAGLSGSSFTWALFLSGAITNAIPGILMQLVLIPVLVYAMERAGLSLNPGRKKKEERSE
jgi:riboflavin transporter FmnP